MKDFEGLINDMKEKGLIHIAKKSMDKADRLSKQIEALANTEPIEQDMDWWQIRVYILAHDIARQWMPLYSMDINTSLN